MFRLPPTARPSLFLGLPGRPATARATHVLALALTLALGPTGLAAAAQAFPPEVAAVRNDPAGASPAARWAARTILDTEDHQGRPFAVVDKQDARLYVFGGDGRLVGQAPALLGQQVGDHTVPGVGDKPVSQVLPHERTTPAGRFAGEPGFNDGGDPVIWVDYDSGFAIHRVRPGRGHDERMARLARSGPQGKRASLGCVVVAGDFFDRVVRPTLGRGRSVIYVLPETRPVASLFGTALASR